MVHCQVVSYHRGLKSLFQDAVVDEHSGCLDGHPKLGLASDHFRLNKFASPEDNNYRVVCEEIVRFVNDAPSRVASRRPCKDSSPTSDYKNTNVMAFQLCRYYQNPIHLTLKVTPDRYLAQHSMPEMRSKKETKQAFKRCSSQILLMTWK